MKRVLTAAAAATVFALAACGSGGSSNSNSSGSSPSAPSSSAAGTPASGPHNEADVQFATMMIPHHGQAVQMADQAGRKAGNAQVKALAQQIKGAQDPEIRTMSGWLVGWNAPVPPVSMDPAMGGMGMDGMMSAAEMKQLEQATGPAFDRLWLTLMTKHHRGAIVMAQKELSQGQNGEAKKLARSISTGQAREVATMTKLRSALPS